MMNWQVGFISLGCAKNLVDSQTMAGYLLRAKIKLATSVETADAIIVNTCAFIESAREEAAEAILGACERKREGSCKAVIVTGCLPQRYKARARTAFPYVDAFLGTDQLEEIVPTLTTLYNGQRWCGAIAPGTSCKLYNPPYPTLLFSGGPFAYIKLGEGCSHRCAYCAIPQIRGAARFRKVGSIVAEAKSIIQAGVRELNLIAQDVLSYHDGQRTGIVELLKKICLIPGDYRVRLLYGYPGAVSDKLLEFIANEPKCCNYFDLPIQHASPKILTAMNRADIANTVTTLPTRIRKVIPDATLRTTCLVGFPGETHHDFKLLLQFIEEAKFDHLGCFTFSPEEGTSAAKMYLTPSQRVSNLRYEELMTSQRKIALSLNRARIGQTGRALLLRRLQNMKWEARLDHQAPDVDGITLVEGLSPTAQLGSFVPVCIKARRGYNLIAEPL